MFRLPSSWWCLQWLALVDTCTWETRWGAKVGGNLLGSDFLREIFKCFFFPGKFWSPVVDIPCFWELRVGRVKIVYSMPFFNARNRCKKRPEVDGMMKLGKEKIILGTFFRWFIKRQCCCLTSLWPQEWEPSLWHSFPSGSRFLWIKLHWFVWVFSANAKPAGVLGVEACDGQCVHPKMVGHQTSTMIGFFPTKMRARNWSLDTSPAAVPNWLGP